MNDAQYPSQQYPSQQYPSQQQPSHSTSRWTSLLLFSVIAMAAVGYVVGINDGVPRASEFESSASQSDSLPTDPQRADPQRTVHQSDRDANGSILATSYAEMRRSETGPTGRWTPTIDQIPQPDYDLFEEFKPSEQEKQRSTLTRASRRAFNGAPPIIPHEVERTDDAACYACHGKGMRIEDRVANQMCHPFLANCTQCHAPPPPQPFAAVNATVETNFVGLPAPLQGERAFPGAPPTIPHSTWMRDTCLACHGRAAGWAGLETTHPWRTNCQQCHAPPASLNQALTVETITLLPELPIAAPQYPKRFQNRTRVRRHRPLRQTTQKGARLKKPNRPEGCFALFASDPFCRSPPWSEFIGPEGASGAKGRPQLTPGDRFKAS